MLRLASTSLRPEIFFAFLSLLAVSLGQQMTDESADSPAFSVGWDPSRVASSRVPYSDEEAELLGYLAYDNTTVERRPAVIIVPDWDGVKPFVVSHR